MSEFRHKSFIYVQKEVSRMKITIFHNYRLVCLGIENRKRMTENGIFSRIPRN